MKLQLLFILILFPVLLISRNYESVTYSPYFDAYFATDPASGEIIKITDDSEEVFVDGLKSPKGIINDMEVYLWVTDINNIVQIDLYSGSVLNTIQIPGAKFLNDIEIDSYGYLYITDTQNSIIYKYDYLEKQTEEYVTTGISAPNGIEYSEELDLLLFVTFDTKGSIYVIDPDKNVNLLADTYKAQLDGIQFNAKEDKLYVSSWNTSEVIEFDVEYSQDLELSVENMNVFKSDLSSPADIYFNSYREELAVPLFNQGEIKYFPFPPLPSVPNDVAYNADDNLIYISNYSTQKVISTELSDNFDNAEYQSFKQLKFPSTGVEYLNGYVYITAGMNIYKINKSNPDDYVLYEHNFFIDDMDVISDNQVITLTQKSSINIIDLENNKDYRFDNKKAILLSTDDSYLYTIESDNDIISLVKYNLDNYLDNISTKLINQNYRFLQLTDQNELLIAYSSEDNTEYGFMIYNSTDLSEVQTIQTYDYSFPQGIIKVNDNYIYTVPYEDKIYSTELTSVTKEINDEFLNVYPNPTDDYLKFDLNNFDFRIYDNTGNLILKGFSKTGKINVNNLITGNYLILINENNNISIKKFIKK